MSFGGHSRLQTKGEVVEEDEIEEGQAEGLDKVDLMIQKGYGLGCSSTDLKLERLA